MRLELEFTKNKRHLKCLIRCREPVSAPAAGRVATVHNVYRDKAARTARAASRISATAARSTKVQRIAVQI